MIETSRRSFISGLATLIAAPAIVKASSLMKVSAIPLEFKRGAHLRMVFNNRYVRTYMDIRAVRDRNVLLQVSDYAEGPFTTYRGIPIFVTDKLIRSGQ